MPFGVGIMTARRVQVTGSREPSWQTVARILAERMENHAHCAFHSLTRAVPDDCPFCADREAYRIWTAKARYVQPAPDPTARLVRLEDVPRSDHVTRAAP
jgi:hypothetical protein